MNILLINANPVVSRLLVLCTRDATIILDEVSVVQDVTKNTVYDMIFVDEASYRRDVSELLVTLDRAKKVFISYRKDAMLGFAQTIKKPFLPSQIIDVIQDAELPLEEEERVDLECLGDVITDDINDPMILDGNEIEKIKALLEMGDQIELTDGVLSEAEIEVRKIEVIKEQLISEGLEIVEENAIVEELSMDVTGTFKVKNKTKKSKLIKRAVKHVIKNMTQKQRKSLLKGKEVEIQIKLEDNK